MIQITMPRPELNQPARMRFLLWLVAVGILAALLALLTVAIANNPTPSQDVSVLDWVAGWDLPGLTTFFDVVSLITDAEAGIIYGVMGIGFLLLMGKARAAVVFGVVGLTIGVVAILGDYTLGEIVGRGRPLAGPDNLKPAFPSGHVFGTTVFFGFIGFLAVYYGLKTKILIPLLLLLAAMIMLVAIRPPTPRIPRGYEPPGKWRALAVRRATVREAPMSRSSWTSSGQNENTRSKSFTLPV